MSGPGIWDKVRQQWDRHIQDAPQKEFKRLGFYMGYWINFRGL